jgi:hypothetical protein
MSRLGTAVFLAVLGATAAGAQIPDPRIRPGSRPPGGAHRRRRARRARAPSFWPTISSASFNRGLSVLTGLDEVVGGVPCSMALHA